MTRTEYLERFKATVEQWKDFPILIEAAISDLNCRYVGPRGMMLTDHEPISEKDYEEYMALDRAFREKYFGEDPPTQRRSPGVPAQ